MWRRSDGRALVSTVDFFGPVVDDAETWGRIAAANAASDIYAMGGRPLFALNLVVWPRDRLPLELLGDVLRGGARTADEGGWSVVGGHTTDGSEPVYGQAVTGEVDPNRMMSSADARPDQMLILTKPLGAGIISTAHKHLPPAPAPAQALGEAPPAAAAVTNVRDAAESSGQERMQRDAERARAILQRAPREGGVHVQTAGGFRRSTDDDDRTPPDALDCTRPDRFPGDLAALSEALRFATTEMCRLNDLASTLALEAGVRAATDVTGFGLLGHLREMCEASGVGAAVAAPAIPVIPHAAEFAAAGHIPGGTNRNLEAVWPYWRPGWGWGDGGSVGGYSVMLDLLADPQTSGGLLLASPPSSTDDLIAALHESGHTAAVVGETTSRVPAGQIDVRP